jgi:RimJ/RimL family protein N-acetyltransferase
MEECRVMYVVVETDRLILRRFTEQDVDLLVDLDADPEVMRYINGGRPTPRTEIERNVLPAFLSYYDRGQYGFWAVHARERDDFLGWFHLRPPRGAPPDEPELGYRLRRATWGLGYATEGSQALVQRAFAEFGARRVWATTMTVNIASRRVMEKTGLRYVRSYHEDWPEPIPGSEHGEVEYAVERGEWEADPK